MAASVSRDLCVVSGTVSRDARVKLEYIFSLLEWLVMAEMPKQISNVNKSASCATFNFDTIICWESQSLWESVIDLPRRIELTVGEDITAPLTGAETLEQISLFVQSATRD